MSGEGGVEFGAGAEEHVVGGGENADGREVFAEPADAGAENRPGEGELAGLLFADHRVPLGDLDQVLVPEEQPLAVTPVAPVEIGGRGGLDPVRYGDWEKNGRCIDF